MWSLPQYLDITDVLPGEAMLHQHKVLQRCCEAQVFERFTRTIFSLMHEPSTWPQEQTRVYQKEVILNRWMKMSTCRSSGRTTTQIICNTGMQQIAHLCHIYMLCMIYKTERERVWEREREELNSKTLFYKDCSLGSVKNLSNN